MKKTHIPFYSTYEAAKKEDKSQLHYFRVVAETEIHNWYQFDYETYYLLVDEKDQMIQFVAVYRDDIKRFIPAGFSVQQFLNTKYDNDMHRLIANSR